MAALCAAVLVPHAPHGPEPAAAQALPSTPTPTPLPLPSCEEISLEGLVVALFEDTFVTDNAGGGRPNTVLAKNCADGKLLVRGSVHLNRIGGPTVEPVNLAFAYGQCADCETLAVALQLNLYRQGATTVSPRNGAVAVNLQCTRCVTVARAIQYTSDVENPSALPPRLAALIQELDHQLRMISQQGGQITLVEAEGKINYAIDQFRDLAASVQDARDERTGSNDPSPTPTASPTPIATATAPATASPTPDQTSVPAATATPLPTATAAMAG